MLTHDIYRNVRMTKETYNLVSQLAKNGGRSFASQSKIIFELGLKKYKRSIK